MLQYRVRMVRRIVYRRNERKTARTDGTKNGRKNRTAERGKRTCDDGGGCNGYHQRTDGRSKQRLIRCAVYACVPVRVCADGGGPGGGFGVGR